MVINPRGIKPLQETMATMRIFSERLNRSYTSLCSLVVWGRRGDSSETVDWLSIKAKSRGRKSQTLSDE